MELKLSEGEIIKALQHYLASTVEGRTARDFAVTFHRKHRGGGITATVEVLKPLPTLTTRPDRRE